jgi:hypothetical protein
LFQLQWQTCQSRPAGGCVAGGSLSIGHASISKITWCGGFPPCGCCRGRIPAVYEAVASLLPQGRGRAPLAGIEPRIRRPSPVRSKR